MGNSEPIVKDMKRLVNKVSEKTNTGIVVGMLPRSYVSHFALSKAIAINERMKKYCDQKKVEFIDLWGMFVGKRHLFRKDGMHLSEAGQRKFGEILNKECKKVMRSDRTAPHRPRCERFFVTAGRSKKEIAKTTVFFWLQKTISRAYELSGTALPVPAPRARETRGIAPSLLFKKNFAVDQVLKAGTWRRHTTFTRHYLRDLAHRSLDTFHLGPVVAAQALV